MGWLFKSFVLVFVLALGVGFARDWFDISQTPVPNTKKVNIGATADPEKAREDTEKKKRLPRRLEKNAERLAEGKYTA